MHRLGGVFIFILGIFWSCSVFAQTQPAHCRAPNLLLVVDTSGSMTQAGKIDALKAAIEQAVNLFKTKLRFGLIHFSNGKANYVVPVGPTDVKNATEAAAHAQKIITTAKNLQAIGDTPMTAAMRLALDKYKTDIIPNDPIHKDPNAKIPRPCYILLMTDGEPTDGDPKAEIAKLRKVTVDSRSYDIKTFVVGMGTDQDIRPFTLHEYAKAGGTKSFYQALTKEDLADVFKTISQSVSTNAEVCNGIDDDCDGVTDEDLKRECSSQCGKGVEICNNGKWTACNAPTPQTEVCDGYDNDCNGQIDEGLIRDCTTACGAGKQSCIHGDWSLCNAPQPEPEICDGKDNDCDGQIDDAVQACPSGKCIEESGTFKCDVDCKSGECPSGFICDNATQKCKELPCRNDPCRAGEVCVNRPNFQHDCIDPCQGVQCPAGQTCGKSGTCINCYDPATPCAPGMICLEGRCTLDSCYKVKCGPGQGCRDGKCFDTCAEKSCPNGQVCQTLDPKKPRAACIPDPCYGVTCANGQACVDGNCVSNKCQAAANCASGQVCDPTTGLCQDNPCQRTHCPTGTACVKGECVKGNGSNNPTSGAQCSTDPDCASAGKTPDGRGYVCNNGFCVPPGSVGGGTACACLVAPGGMAPSNPIFFFGVLFFFVFIRRRLQGRVG